MDARLYLPQPWTSDAARCDKADIPQAEQVHRTKLELAWEIIRHARHTGLRFEWIGMDGLYGHSLELLQALQVQGEVFLADIHADRHIYAEDPRPLLPAAKDRGHKPMHFHSRARPVEVRQWVKQRPATAWRKETLRSTTKADLVVKLLHRRVWLWDKKGPTAQCWHLIVRREVNSPGTVKYSLSNAPADTSVTTLAQMQAQRFWIERAFQDAKSHIGMARPDADP